MYETDGATAPDIAFQGYLVAGEIRLQLCLDCGRQVFPPRVLCPRCGSEQLQWDLADPRATVYSTTTVRQKPERGGDYNVAVIEMAQGARLLSRVTGKAPREVGIGDVVTAAIDSVDGQPLIVFRPTVELSDEVTR